MCAIDEVDGVERQSGLEVVHVSECCSDVGEGQLHVVVRVLYELAQSEVCQESDFPLAGVFLSKKDRVIPVAFDEASADVV